MKRVLGALAALAMASAAHAGGEFFADAASGCKAWNPSPQPGERIKWEGACVNGFAQGQGKLTYLGEKGTSETSIGYFRAGKAFGKYELRKYDASGALTYPVVTRFPAESDGPAETYRKAAYENGGVAIDYMNAGKVQGAYRAKVVNDELAAFTMPQGNDTPVNGRTNVIYLASYNAATRAWSAWPDAKARDEKQLYGHALVTGDPGAFSVGECQDRDACAQRFQAALVQQGYAGWDKARMDDIDARWDAARQALEKADAATAAHARNIATLPADKLFTYGSRQEQDRRYDLALDAYRTIVEKFPKSRLMDAAVARMAAVQDKIDQKTAQDEADGAQAKVAAQRVAADNQRQQAQAQAQAQRMEEERQRRLVAYNQCKSTADQCTTDCLTTAGAGVIGGIAGLINRNAINTNGLDMINQRAQNTCSRCDAMSKQCDAMKPST